MPILFAYTTLNELCQKAGWTHEVGKKRECRVKVDIPTKQTPLLQSKLTPPS